MPEPNPNRDLPADQVVHLFVKQLPAMFDGLAADREWLWWSGDKPSDAHRAILLEIGFRFTPRPHRLPDGRTAHWYHSCGGAVYRRKSVNNNYRSARRPSSGENRPAPAAESHHEADSELAKLAAALGAAA